MVTSFRLTAKDSSLFNVGENHILRPEKQCAVFIETTLIVVRVLFIYFYFRTTVIWFTFSKLHWILGSTLFSIYAINCPLTAIEKQYKFELMFCVTELGECRQIQKTMLRKQYINELNNAPSAWNNRSHRIRERIKIQVWKRYRTTRHLKYDKWTHLK